MLNKKSLIISLGLFLLCSTSFAQEKDSLFHVYFGTRSGFIDKTGKIVVKPKEFKTCNGLASFSEGLMVMCSSSSDKMGFIDKTGEFVIKQEFDDAKDFSEGLALVVFGDYGLHNQNDYKVGFIDKAGNLAIKPIYRDAKSFSEGLAVVSKDGKYGFIDKNGETKIPFELDYAGSFSEGLAVIYKNNNYGFIDKKGNISIMPKFKGAGSFSEDLAWVKTNGQTYPYTIGDLYLGEGNESFSYIDKNGTVVIKIKAWRVGDFSEGLAAVQTENKIGFIDKKGKFVIELKRGFHPQLPKFSEGLAKIQPDVENQIFIDKNGKNPFSKHFESVTNFENGLAYVCEKETDLCGYINKKGEYVWKAIK